MSESKTYRERPVSFVRRSGRMTQAQERGWVELSPQFLLPVQREEGATSVHAEAAMAPAEVWVREAPLIVEIGSGQGHAIVHAASSRPQHNFLAIEVYRAGLARTMLDAYRVGAHNLRLIEANAPEVLQKLLPPGSVSELWVFFPDPWHKHRHVKRRLVGEEFAALATSALAENGILRLATDWEEYAIHMRGALDSAPELVRDFSGEWAPRFEGRVLTAFERKGSRAGRHIRDLSYRCSRAAAR